MAQTLIIKESCGGCAGTGQQPLHPSGQTECFQCQGTGKRTVFEVELEPGLDDIMDKVNDIKEKVDEIKSVCDDIWSKVNE